MPAWTRTAPLVLDPRALPVAVGAEHAAVTGLGREPVVVRGIDLTMQRSSGIVSTLPAPHSGQVMVTSRTATAGSYAVQRIVGRIVLNTHVLRQSSEIGDRTRLASRRSGRRPRRVVTAPQCTLLSHRSAPELVDSNNHDYSAARMMDERDELMARLTRIQQLTNDLLKAQMTGREQRELAARIVREVTAAREALRPVDA